MSEQDPSSHKLKAELITAGAIAGIGATSALIAYLLKKQREDYKAGDSQSHIVTWVETANKRTKDLWEALGARAVDPSRSGRIRHMATRVYLPEDATPYDDTEAEQIVGFPGTDAESEER